MSRRGFQSRAAQTLREERERLARGDVVWRHNLGLRHVVQGKPLNGLRLLGESILYRLKYLRIKVKG